MSELRDKTLKTKNYIVEEEVTIPMGNIVSGMTERSKCGLTQI
ncbi:hypothetical protein [[Ruminococcus] torques]|nr:hypothetical protein [[Ruminococcus] torques]